MTDRIFCGTLLPAYYSYKSLKDKRSKKKSVLLQYWIVYSCYKGLTFVTDRFLFWFPLYSAVKFAFVLGLIAPGGGLCNLIYSYLVQPLISSKEKRIDEALKEIKSQMKEQSQVFAGKVVAEIHRSMSQSAQEDLEASTE